MLREFLKWLLMGVLVFGIVGCGGGTNATSETNTTKSTEDNSTTADTTAPNITLTGANPQIIEKGTAYTELGASADDGSTVDINSTTVDINTVGTYSVSYNATDTVGNSAIEVNRTVEVKDTTAPSFTSPNSATVAENQTDAITLVATDKSTVSYSISGGDSTDFNINNGVLTFKVAPDYENKTSYTFTATASDGLNETNQTVTINISNIAETAPTLGGDLNLSIIETTSIGTDIGTITISNTGDTDISSFEINGTDNTIISIATNGTISLAEALNYESKTFYEFNITAINGAGRSNTISLELNVTDYNETSITLAVYDNNNTTTATDDTLRVYFSKAIDELTRSNVSANNYAIEGLGDLDGASGVYNAIYKEDKIGSIITALTPYENNISVVANTIKDSNNINAKSLSTRLISAYAIKKTGQTLSYEANGSIHTNGTQKDDGYYQSGETSHYRRDDNKEVVLDLITGLMWADDANVSSVTKQWVTQANYDAGSYSNTSGDTATTYCTNLTLGGYSDWRLPTVKELLFIVDNSKSNPSIDSHFKHISPEYHWSSSTYMDTDSQAWRVYFRHGYARKYAKDGSLFVRCVRAGQ